MKKLLALVLITASLSSCAGFMEKATIVYGKASTGFQDSTGISLAQGFDILTGAVKGYASMRDANKLVLDNAGSPLPPWPTPVPAPSGKAVADPQPKSEPAPVQATPAGNWWSTIF